MFYRDEPVLLSPNLSPTKPPKSPNSRAAALQRRRLRTTSFTGA